MRLVYQIYRISAKVGKIERALGVLSFILAAVNEAHQQEQSFEASDQEWSRAQEAVCDLVVEEDEEAAGLLQFTTDEPSPLKALMRDGPDWKTLQNARAHLLRMKGDLLIERAALKKKT